MQTTLTNKGAETLESSPSDLQIVNESIQQTTQEDKDYSKTEHLTKYNTEVTSEYLHELPPSIQAKMSVGKRLYSGCVRNHHKEVTTYLMDADLWLKFQEQGTEMIITKKGRRVFPAPTYGLSDLDPEKLYDVSLEIHSVDHTMHKFCNGEWLSSKERALFYPTPVPGRSTFLHPFSPNTGLHWMREPISFSGMKISNNVDAFGTVVLQSMRKYVMSLVISELNGSMKVKIHQPETAFVAVTQYQNVRITQMKIEHNPFANGFRFSSNKREKPKRLHSQDTESEDEGKPDEAGLFNSSPLEAPKKQSFLNRVKSETVCPETIKLVAYLEKNNQFSEVFYHPFWTSGKLDLHGRINLESKTREAGRLISCRNVGHHTLCTTMCRIFPEPQTKAVLCFLSEKQIL